ncbi:MAG: hypothetical protein KY475_12330 [Planctomycetes bacterium]|nr:hypothetical protein [Planctomycetota bacterium]
MNAMKNRVLDYLSSAPPSEQDGGSLRESVDPHRMASAAEQWIAKNPGVALGAAVTVGVFLGWLIKRK